MIHLLVAILTVYLIIVWAPIVFNLLIVFVLFMDNIGKSAETKIEYFMNRSLPVFFSKLSGKSRKPGLVPTTIDTDYTWRCK